MKANGIGRRIDDLGRVVIPKEIRRTMRIREGDPLEIYTTKDGEVIFKKYSLLGGLEDFAAQFCDTLSRSTEFTAAVTDRDAIIAVAGGSCWVRPSPSRWSGSWRIGRCGCGTAARSRWLPARA